MANTVSSSSTRNHFLAVRRSLSALDRSLARLSASINGVGSVLSPPKGSSRKLSPRARAALKLQGRYMGFMRQLKPRQKADVRAVREKKGIETAIKRARQMADR